MNTSQRPAAPTVEQVNSRVSDICSYLDPSDERELFWYLIHRAREPSVKMVKVYKVAMEYLAWREAGGAALGTLSVKDRYSPETLPDPKKGESEAVKARTSARDLRAKLWSYYQTNFGMHLSKDRLRDPHPREVSAGKAEWILYIEIPLGDGYRPIIEWRTAAIIQTIELAEDRIDFECIGTNLQAMQYLAKHIPLAQKIEDTAIRWDANNMPYAGLDEFKAGLKQSKATYVLITGPVKYKDYMEVLKEIFWDKSGQGALFKCFRLDRTVPIMNFTILYYPDKSSEVLYGYGIQQGKNSVESTTVFRSNHPDLVKEYKRLFKALRDHPSSNQISVHDPDFVDSDESESDVSATVENFRQLSIENLVRKEPTGQINVCVTCSDEIGPLVGILKDYLSVTAPIKILLSHPDSSFLSWREKSLSRNLKKLVRSNLYSLQQLFPRSHCEVKLTDRVMPVMFIQIGSTIIFSPFWNGTAAATSPQFTVRANSKTGSFLKENFDELWIDEYSLSVGLSAENLVIPPLPQNPNYYISSHTGVSVRKAHPDDAETVCVIAASRSREARLKAQISERRLAREGFLFYPLTRDQYRERISGSDHFWVAERDGKIVAYCMAYTFAELGSFTFLTDNDHSVLDYFRSWGCEPGCVYFAQAATILSHEARGAMAELAVCLPKYAVERGVPAILCEISLQPRNDASLAAANRTGFRMVATRTKNNPSEKKDRVSGTFMRILEDNAWR
jgi:predicted GNAT superfamily acetyltransferase